METVCEHACNRVDVLLFDYWHKLCSEVLAVKPPLEQDVSGVIYIVPESTSTR